jgi:hypothetical protein
VTIRLPDQKPVPRARYRPVDDTVTVRGQLAIIFHVSDLHLDMCGRSIRQRKTIFRNLLDAVLSDREKGTTLFVELTDRFHSRADVRAWNALQLILLRLADATASRNSHVEPTRILIQTGD